MTIRQHYRPNHGGWGSLRVSVKVGTTTWPTSLFWMKEGGYLLFIKASVRKAENLRHGAFVRARFTLLNV